MRQSVSLPITLKKNIFFLSLLMVFMGGVVVHGEEAPKQHKEEHQQRKPHDEDEKFNTPLKKDNSDYVKIVSVKEFGKSNTGTLSGKLFPSLSPQKESMEDILRKRKAKDRVDLERAARRGGRVIKKQERSQRLTCKDLLGGYLALPEDADVNSVCHECYTYCLMEMVLLQVLHDNSTHVLETKISKATEKQLEESLVVIQALIPALLSSCVAAFIAFRYEATGMRQRINELQRTVQNS